MSQFYEEMRAVADQLLAEFGRPITIRRVTASTDLVTGVVTSVVALEQDLNAAVVPASKGTLEAFDVRFMSDVLDDLNVRFAIVSAEGATFVPGPRDVAEFDGRDDWQVMGCTPLNVDGTAVVFSVGLRQP